MATIPRIRTGRRSRCPRAAVTRRCWSRNRANFGGPLIMGLGQLPARRHAHGRADGPRAERRASRVRGEADAAIGGFLTTITAAPADPKVKVPCQTAFDAVFSIGPEQHAVLAALHRPHRGRGRRGRPVLDRSDRAEGAARAEWFVQPAGRGEARRRLQGCRSRCYPLWTPPGMGIAGLGRDPTGQDRERAADERGRQRRRTEVEDRGHAVARRGQGAGVDVEPVVHDRDRRRRRSR